MIVAEQKPIEEILKSLEGHGKVLIVACGTCVTVCMAGGEKEAVKLASLLEVVNKDRGMDQSIEVVVSKRQCDREFLDEIRDAVDRNDIVLSMGCGAGVQFMTEIFPERIILPALNTKFLGVTKELGVWSEMCQGCGDCILEKTGGICPVTRCSKSNFNGPCGGSSQGKCEIDPTIDCGWQLIYDRLKALNSLDKLYETIEPKDWRTSRDGGPRKVVKEEMMTYDR
ncbi:MAG: methylenetetrahydrofolate reductase C-terminal domain-containing protein [Mahellales bacterium]